MILAQSSLTSNNQYSVVFGVDTIDTIPNYEYGIRYSTSEINVYNTSSGSLIYSEALRNLLAVTWLKVIHWVFGI